MSRNILFLGTAVMYLAGFALFVPQMLSANSVALASGATLGFWLVYILGTMASVVLWLIVAAIKKEKFKHLG